MRVLRELVILFLPYAVATAQQTISGRVVDSAAHPISGATVAVVGTATVRTTDMRGDFQLALDSGEWMLSVRHVGFAPAERRVRVGEGRGKSVPAGEVVITLARRAVRLTGVSVESERGSMLAQTLTTESVRQVPPLVEPDVFRAVVLLPMVSEPNDLKGRIHLAGGSSDETGVRLDGHPLQDPFHLLGVLGAFNVDALERADVLMHHLPPAYDNRLSGVIDLETRRSTEQSHGEVTMSLLSAGGMLMTSAARSVDLLVAARQTFLDRILARIAADSHVADRGQTVPRYGDGLVRLGYAPVDGLRMEVLGFATRDELHPLSDGDEIGVVTAQPLAWGESLAGLRTTVTRGRWDGSARLSWDRYAVDLRRGAESIAVRRDWLSSAVTVGRSFAGARVSGGAELDARKFRNAWTGIGSQRSIFSPRTPASYDGLDARTAFASYVSIDIPLSARWLVSAAERITVVPGDGARPAARTAVRFRPRSGLSLQAAYDRRFQYDAQLEEPLEGSVNAPVFLLNRPRVADVFALSAGADHPAGRLSTSANVQAFFKNYHDRAVLRPVGDSAPGAFPDFLRVPGRSYGVAIAGTLALRNVGLLQGNYTYQRATERVDSIWSPTSFDAPHNVSMFASVRGPWRTTINAGLSMHSGTPVTPPEASLYVPAPDLGFDFSPRFVFGARNSVRTPAFERVDLGLRRAWVARGATWTLSIQAVNVLNRANQLDIDWFTYLCRQAGRCLDQPAGRSELPFVPSIGLEIRW